jgi:NAD-dependent deacetylase
MFSLFKRRPNSAAIRRARDLIHNAKHVVVLTGAGLSTRSGIPDFRSPQSGIWENVDPMQVASIEEFRNNPQAFYNWLKPLAALIRAAKPNAAHKALAQLEKNGQLAALITQNIDGLHTTAGSKNIHQLHGNMQEMHCLFCGRSYQGAAFIEDFLTFGTLPVCDCGRILKPSLTLFGEMLPMHAMLAAHSHVQACDLMIVAGSSLQVSPAADLPATALRTGAKIVNINLEANWVDDSAEISLHADVTQILPQLV